MHVSYLKAAAWGPHQIAALTVSYHWVQITPSLLRQGKAQDTCMMIISSSYDDYIQPNQTQAGTRGQSTPKVETQVTSAASGATMSLIWVPGINWNFDKLLPAKLFKSIFEVGDQFLTTISIPNVKKVVNSKNFFFSTINFLVLVD